MVHAQIQVDADEEEAWRVLCDASRYADWVVCAKRIRMTEGDFPEPGAIFHHTIGVGPASVDDDTRVLASADSESLKLDAGMGPFGRADVEILVRPQTHGVLIEMREAPREGLAALVHNPIFDRVLWLRNVISLRRLRALIEQEAKKAP